MLPRARWGYRLGNDQIVAGLVDGIGQSRIMRSHELVAIAGADGGYTLTFKNDGGTKVVKADRVVLALPFSILRDSVDYSKADFQPLKVTAIEEQGMGSNSKLHLQFARRHWYRLGNNGNSYADTGYQATWEVTRAQPGTAGILVDYTGGSIADTFGSGTAAGKAKAFLKQIEPVLQGVTAQWNGLATVDCWRDNPWSKGAYSFWKVGQYTKFSGMERKRQGNCHFAGEHTSVDFQGYLNGAVDSGENAADEILADLK
jgi:monoamine oxidase